jgi:FkbM family methyltransferase
MKFIYRKLRSLVSKSSNGKGENHIVSYSQCGEDIILQYIFKQLNILTPSYIDIGAHNPIFLSNTHLFYLTGSTGINIEPDPDLISSFNTCRPRDININAGIGLEETEDLIDFYIMSNRVLNTFSKEGAKRVAAYGTYKIESVKKVRVIPLKNIIDKYFPSQNGPDLISLDVEGLDYEILNTIDLTKYKKTIFCIETLSYTEDNSETKNDAIFKYFHDNGFFTYADTYINTIFVNKEYWGNR